LVGALAHQAAHSSKLHGRLYGVQPGDEWRTPGIVRFLERQPACPM